MLSYKRADQHRFAARGPGHRCQASRALPGRTTKKPSPAFTGEGFVFHRIKSLAVTYFHIDKVDTSIGAERFHFRVRKGIGWFPLAMAARQTGRNGVWSCPAPTANSYNLFRCLVAFKSIDHSTTIRR